MTKRALLIMCKQPAPGRTKTRLSPPYSLEEAATLYTHFLKDAIEIGRALPGVVPFLAYAGSEDGDDAAYFAELAPDCCQIEQLGPALGDRLDHVMSTCLADGFDQVVAMCSDSPALPAEYVMRGFSDLDREDVDATLGPCDDGGYYLIGWKRPHPRMVKAVVMSTESVFADTLAIAEADQIRVSVLPEFWDIDTAADLDRLRKVGPGVASQTLRFLASFSH